MANLREAFHRILSFLHWQRRDSDLDAEFQSHLDLAIEENISHGMSPEEARRRALVRFGGVQQAKEQQRKARGLPWLDVLLLLALIGLNGVLAMSELAIVSSRRSRLMALQRRGSLGAEEAIIRIPDLSQLRRSTTPRMVVATAAWTGLTSLLGILRRPR
jgi:hypothetical protein